MYSNMPNYVMNIQKSREISSDWEPVMEPAKVIQVWHSYISYLYGEASDFDYFDGDFKRKTVTTNVDQIFRENTHNSPFLNHCAWQD